MIEKITSIIFGQVAYAATVDELLSQGDKTVAANGSILTLAHSLIDRIPYILGALAVFGMMYSGFLYVMALGDATKMEMAKKNITWILTGILAVAAVIIIMNIAIKVTGSGILPGSPLE
jgi:hypothetical protein